MEQYAEVVLDLAGNAVPGASVQVLVGSANGSLATIYDASGTPQQNPIPTGLRGDFAFQVANGKYVLRVLVNGKPFATVGPLTFYDPADDTRFGSLDPQLRTDVNSAAAAAAAATTKLLEYVSVRDKRFAGGAKGDGVANDTAAIQAAMNFGGRVFFPPGRYMVSAPLLRPDTGLIIEGAGIDATIIEPTADFVGSAVLILGKKFAAGECRQISMRDFLIDLKGRVDAGVEMYGLRDGSSFESVYIWKIRKYGFRTGWTNAGNGAPFTMNQGIKFDNCHVLSRNDGGVAADGAYYDLSGLYESVLLNCKALGYDASGATHTNMDGFRIGGVASGNLGDADCQGVRLYNCSAGNFIGTGNRGIFFGNAFHCSADVPTVENVQGAAFVFGQAKTSGTASDQYSAAYCQVTAPRLYNPAGDAAVSATKFEFSGNATQCSVRNVATVGLLPGQKLARFLATAALNEVHVLAGNIDPASMAGYIDFVSLDPSNIVRAFTNSTTTKRQSTFAKDQLYTERSTNGTVIQHTQFYTTINLTQPQRFCKADGTQVMTINPDGTVQYNKNVIPTAAVGNPGVIWMDAANGNALKLI